MSLSLLIVSAFELELEVVNYVLASFSIFLNSKASVVTNLNSLILDNKFIGLSFIVDSASLSCNPGLKEFKISTL